MDARGYVGVERNTNGDVGDKTKRTRNKEGSMQRVHYPAGAWSPVSLENSADHVPWWRGEGTGVLMPLSHQEFTQ